ncbi:hypothetical protein GNX71_13680 [Variovorax sp. RKNM96]|uniref:hypothetical protein n=1 Tax=Variovorax sp. RKNM96 TaxID=2681552 RepID=UPI00198193AF|nr:hypothetical protein [Variovorax sp. RKNM96]QSI30573.1 hypothetical protein GNX71_13680 [Variovorax sp. RKNM96]
MAQYGVDSPVNMIEGAASQSGVSWGAILAGAVGAASLSLILLLLGTGLGMSSISPWTDRGASAATIGIATILWLTFTQIAASGMGGYLAGRLRTKWAGVHSDEVYFRDTAHGFLAWAVATLLTAALLGSVVGSILGAGAQAGATVAGGAATAATAASAGAAGSPAGSESSTGPMNYFIDSLFRRDSVGTPAAPADGMAPTTAAAAPNGNTASSNAEISRIFLNSIRTGALPPEDARYAGQVVAQRTGLSQQDAEKRVNDTYAKAQATLKDAQAKAKEAADAARKASAYGSLWLVISMLIGAFVASFAATSGGRRRDL